MDIAPLAIVQARMGSTRLPGKMMLPLGGRPLVYWAWRKAVEAFGPRNVVVAVPAGAENRVLLDFFSRPTMGAMIYEWGGPESDVLGRFWHCAHHFRWHPDSVICRITPDDPFKSPDLMRRVAMYGERHPVGMSCEAFTLHQLDAAHFQIQDLDAREHLTRAFFPDAGPLPPDDQIWTVDTEADLVAAEERMAGEEVS